MNYTLGFKHLYISECYIDTQSLILCIFFQIIGITCLIQNSLNMDKPAPKTPFQQHFCGILNRFSYIFFTTVFTRILLQYGLTNN